MKIEFKYRKNYVGDDTGLLACQAMRRFQINFKPQLREGDLLSYAIRDKSLK